MSSIASGTTTTTALVYTADTSGVLQLQTNGTTTAVTIDTAQNLLVGGTSALNSSSGRGDVEIFGSSSAITSYNIGGSIAGYLFHDGTNFQLNNNINNSGTIQFYTRTSGSGTEKVRIDNTGNLFVGYTSGGASATSIVRSNGYNCKQGLGSSLSANVFNMYWTGTSMTLYVDSTSLGTISTSSDYRIKKNIETQTVTAIDRILSLRPVTYELADYDNLFKADGVKREGFIAHELQEIIPSAVEGEKDSINQVQSLKLDALCSVLVKAIQELSAKVTALEAKVA